MPAAKKPKTKPTPKPKSPRKKTAEIAAVVHERMSLALPVPRVELDFADAWQLVIATILSAQSTDKTVNQVTPALFARYPTPAALAAALQEDVEVLVKTTGFFRNKAKAIRAASQMITERFAGKVPRTIQEVVELPGVARKTANVVLGSAYRITTGIVVDTHVGRVSRRLKLTRKEDPVDVETALMKLFPRESWIDTGHRLVLHGRYVCTARAPDCAGCVLNETCASAEAEPTGDWQSRASSEREKVQGGARPATNTPK